MSGYVEVLDRRGRGRVVTEFHDESLTYQPDYELTRIDKIMERFGVTGMQEHLREVDAMFMDVTELPEDYQAVQEYMIFAEGEFMKLPPKVRERFGHDVARWLDAAHDQEKADVIVGKVQKESGGGPEAPASEVAGGNTAEGGEGA